ncbi:hypothetical protein H8D85_01665 [bacterium]|nr:hypothetical protein [bacterium]
MRKASKALEVEKLNQKTQRLLDKTHRLEQGKPGTIGSLISGALAVSAAGALGGGLLMHQYDSHAEKKRQKEIATRFYFEGLKRGRS